MNSALAALLRGNNTTISIAHRLSTIKRSDLLIVLSSDGKVAEQGSFKELSAKRDGAFTKLMEWQMNGGSVDEGNTSGNDFAAPPPGRGPPTEAEEIRERLDQASEGEGYGEGEHDTDRIPDSYAKNERGGSRSGEENVDDEALKVKKEKATAPEVVLQKASKHES